MLVFDQTGPIEGIPADRLSAIVTCWHPSWMPHGGLQAYRHFAEIYILCKCWDKASIVFVTLCKKNVSFW